MGGTEIAPFISFESDEAAEIKVTSDRIKESSEIIVRPQSKNVEITKNGNEAIFTLSRHGAYTFEVDSFNEALHIEER